MTDQHLRRSNWPSLTGNDGAARPASSTRDMGEDPLAELARLVGKSDPFADLHATRPRAAFSERQEPTFDRQPAFEVPPAFEVAPAYEAAPVMERPAPAPVAPVSVSSAPVHAGAAKSAPLEDDFFGIDAAAFEAALQVAPAAPKSVQPPVFAPEPARLAPAARAPEFATADELERLVRDLDEEMIQSQARLPRTDAYQVPPVAGYEAAAPAGATIYPPSDAYPPQAYAPHDGYGDDPHYDLRQGVDPQGYEAVPVPAPVAMPAKRGFFANGGMVTVVSVLGLVVVGAAGAGIYSSLSSKKNSGPVVIRADDKPNKIQPDATPQAGNAQPGKLIYDRAGGQGSDASSERIVSRQEQPVDTSAPAGGASPRVVLPGGPSVNAPVAPGAEPRRVSTTTIRVRPDGTVEAEPTRPAQAPQAQPVAPVAPPVVAPVAEAAAPVAPASTIGTPLPKPVTTKPVVQARVEPARTNAPVVAPARAPAATSGPMSLVPNATPGRGAPPAPLAVPSAAPQRVAAAPASASGSGSYFVQVSSQRSDEAAKRALADVQRKHGGVMAGQPTSIKAVDVAGSGTFYRVRVGPLNTRDQAVAFCGRLKASGGDCYVP